MNDTWLSAALQRLESDRFKVRQNHQDFRAVAHVSRFELTKFGNCETFFVFREFKSLDPAALRSFSAAAFSYARASKSFPLPRGLFEAVYAFAVGIVDELDPASAEAVRTGEPQKHWAAAEIPVVYERSANRLCFFEKTPVWGGAYYKGFRNQIQKYLGTA